MNDAEHIARALGNGQRSGVQWLASCPVHSHGRGRGDKNPSLSIRNDGHTVLFHCFTGCSQEQVLDALQSRGLWEASGASDRFTHVAEAKPPRADARALALWRDAVPAAGTLVERYLRTRGITCAIPPSIRFLKDTKHPEGRLPAMLAAVTRAPSRKIVAVHRTFLAPNGSGKAPAKPERMDLGPVGGGAVRLAPAGGHLAVAEGIETALSVAQATCVPTWSALSAGGIFALILPPLPHARTVTICADADDGGAGLDAVHKAAERWSFEGRTVRIALPPLGTDFNDVLNDNLLRRTNAA